MELRQPRFNEYLVVRFGLIATVLAAVGLFGAGLLMQSGDVTVLQKRHHLSASEKELLQELTALRAAWDPKQRVRILQRAAERTTEYAGPLHRILRMPRHPKLEAAVEYAGALGALELRPTLVEMVDSKSRLAAAALRAAEQLQPWSRTRLGELLQGDSPAVQLAVLEVCSRRRDAPWPQIVELLYDADEMLREAAIAAIPRRLSPELQRELWTMVDDGSPSVARVGLQALSRTVLTSELEVKLAAVLRRLDTEAQLLVLDYLATKGSALQARDEVWALVEEESEDLPVRARALYCLEQTGSCDTTALQRLLPSLGPELQYFAARCLVPKQPALAGRVLLDLLEQAEGETVVQSRRLLAWLAGISPSSTPAQFRAAMGQSAAAGRQPPSYRFGQQ